MAALPFPLAENKIQLYANPSLNLVAVEEHTSALVCVVLLQSIWLCRRQKLVMDLYYDGGTPWERWPTIEVREGRRNWTLEV